MKKIYFCTAILLACSGVQAQYKKATFLNKSGRTYDLGLAAHFLSGGVGTFPGIYYSYGRDQGKRTFYWFDIEALLPTKFSYNTIDKNNPQTAVTITTKSKLSLAYRFNYAYYLADPENAASKFKPFVTAGINILITNSLDQAAYTSKPENTDPVKYADFSGFSYGANAGIGGIYALSEKFGLKVMAGYSLQFQKHNSEYTIDEGHTAFNVYSSHPYASVGVRFLINADGE